MTAIPEGAKLTSFLLDGRAVDALPGETILQAARRHGVEIPHLCYKDGLRPDGNCRACVVEVKGERPLAPACCRTPQEGMEVASTSERARLSQKMVLELLLSDVVETPYTRDSELATWADALEVGPPRFAPRRQPQADESHPAIAVNLDACIQCTRCQRACREEQVNDVIGYALRGSQAKIVFDVDDPMGSSSCVGCGECVQACPTGALMPAKEVGLIEPDKTVDSVCPYCGVGCLLTYHVKDNTILHVTGRDGPSNHGRLCVKGRYGFDYITHPHRLTQPLIRKSGVPKSTELTIDPADPSDVFRAASWEEALDVAAGGLKKIRDEKGGQALAGFGSAKGSNEEAYLFQKLVRTGFGTNNVDHCTRLCHASSVAALLEGIGSGAVSNQVADVAEAECIIVIGSNASENHPVAATFMKNAAKAGKTLVVMDPRRTELARHAAYYLQFKPDTDVALLNAMMHTIIEEGLVHREFIEQRTAGFELIKQNVAGFSPEEMEPVCGIAAETIREVARRYATASGSMIFWGMGVSQHIHGTDNARCLIALALMTGQIGRPGTGLHPLRGQNNVQGASDAGLIPMMFPDYQRVDNEEIRQRFEALWGVSLDPQAGLTVVEIMDAILADRLHGMYIMGENPAMSDPNLHHARQALAKLDHLVVQDFIPDRDRGVCRRDSAGVRTPGEDRHVHQHRPARPTRPESARPAGPGPPGPGHHSGDGAPSGTGLAVSRHRSGLRGDAPGHFRPWGDQLVADREPGLRDLPLLDRRRPGPTGRVSKEFPDCGRHRPLRPARLIHADELPDTEFPFVLITGRQLEHWHTGAMTRRASVLNAIEPQPVINVHPEDLAALDGAEGDLLTIASRRGEITAYARADAGLQRNEIFIPFCYQEAAANLLTNEALDPYGKIPEFKYCAVRVSVNRTAEA